MRPLTIVPLACTLVLGLGLGACAATGSSVRVDKAESGLPNCQTFAWNPSGGEAVSLAEQRIRSQVMQTLKSKGYSEATDKPDCRVSYHVSNGGVQRRSGPSIGVGAGGGSGGIGGGLGISLPIGKKSQPGTFAIDIIDASQNAQVWSGSVDTAFKGSEPNEAESQALVEKVLKEYPDKK
jgi:hypothetical protein